MKYESHKKSNSKLYGVRSRILSKCYNKNITNYKYFGAKGIGVCDEWRNSFTSFEKWALDNGYTKNSFIKLIDKNKDFSPDNCKITHNRLKNQTHGMSGTRIYNIRQAMISRCHNKKDKGFKNYGGKGIVVCNEWKESFENFWEWASKNGYQDDLTIDRINPKGNYEPSNCRWVTMHEQILNQERNKKRTKEDRFIKKTKLGDYRLLFSNRKNGKCNYIFSQTFPTKEEAIEARDYFLKHGKKLDIKKKDNDAYISSLTDIDFEIKRKREVKNRRKMLREQYIQQKRKSA